MKKIMSLLCTFALLTVLVVALSGCSQSKNDDAKDLGVVRVDALKGPTAVGMLKMVNDNKYVDSSESSSESSSGEKSGNLYDFSIKTAPDEITAAISKGEVDVAAVPANLAPILYDKTGGKIKVLTINTYGVLYIVEKGDSVKSLSDLEGKNICATGKGATPEYSLNTLAEKAGLPKGWSTISWQPEPTNCVSELASDKASIALLPEPFVEVALGKVPGLKVALSFNELWNKYEGSDLPTGVTIATTDYIDNHKDSLNRLLSDYKESVDWTNNNVDDAAKLVGDAKIVDESVAKKAIPLMNVSYLDGADMKEKLSAYLEILYKQNPKSIGGKIPADDMYYQG
jgi:NitT/TauT family transport system substrate-binding protein